MANFRSHRWERRRKDCRRTLLPTAGLRKPLMAEAAGDQKTTTTCRLGWTACGGEGEAGVLEFRGIGILALVPES